LTDIRLLLSTAPSAEIAESVVAALVAERLIACGNVTVPMTSIFHWRGETERAGEVLVIMKTTESAVAAATRRIAELHPYEVPEVLSLPVLSGHEPYLSWVREAIANP
jgi:periplasmic divalent cation tolerance protein